MHDSSEPCPVPLSRDIPADFLECLEPDQREKLLGLHPLQQRYLIAASIATAAKEQAKAGTTIPMETLIEAMMKHHEAQSDLIEWGRTQSQFMADPRIQVAYGFWDGAGSKDPEFRRMLCEALVALKPEPLTPSSGAAGTEGDTEAQTWGQLIVVDFSTKGRTHE